MPQTVINYTGDGVLGAIIALAIQLPDSGTEVKVDGRIQPVGAESHTVTGSPVTIPATPAPAHTVTYIIQVNETTGAATVKSQESAEAPEPDAGNVTVFTQTLENSTPDPANAGKNKTPDNL